MEEQGKQLDRSASSKKAGPVKGFDTRCSPTRFLSIVENLSEHQKQVVKDLGFGSLLDLQCRYLKRELCQSLLNTFDLEKKVLIVGKKKMSVTPLSVERVMGLHDHGEDIPVERLTDEETETMMKRYGLSKADKLTLQVLEKKLKDRDNIGLGFMRDFVLFACGSLLCPTSDIGANKKYLRCVLDTSSIANFNWAKIVYDCLIQSIRNYQKKQAERSSKSTITYAGGCLLYLQLLSSFDGDPKPEAPSTEHLTDEDTMKVEETLEVEGSSPVNVSLEDDFSKISIYNGKLGAKRLDLLEIQLEELKSGFEETKNEVEQAQVNWGEELKKLVNGVEVASSCNMKLLKENRDLYNQVQDLKGNIRVYCRVKPMLSDWQSTVEYIGEHGDIMVVDRSKEEKEARKSFSYDKVFSTTVTQEQIYADLRPWIRSVLDGFHVCIFAYGQTGSGKTYTMSGPDLLSEDTWGVNYRSLKDLFELSNERIGVITYEVRLQMIEVYNEQVRDLLVPCGSKTRLEIMNTCQDGIRVPDARLVTVTSIEDVLHLVRTGQSNRVVGATALNVQSSRSHCVLSIHVKGMELASQSILQGCLHLVDLSGSEKADKAEAVGERLNETKNINKSLTALGDVMDALAQKRSHIPYRNSKLTQVLQDSLGGHAKTLMFVHINPEVNAISETLSTLRYAARVSKIELGAARSNKQLGVIKELKEEISSLKLALKRKEAEIDQLKRENVPMNVSLRTPRIVPPSSEIRSHSTVRQPRSRFLNR